MIAIIAAGVLIFAISLINLSILLISVFSMFGKSE